MKKIKNMLLVLGIISALTSCESDNDKYSGTPVGNQDIITLEAVISTPLTKVMTSQKIPFTVVLPRTFVDTVNVEVSAYNRSGTRTRRSVEFLPGISSVNDTIVSSGAVVYDSTIELSATGISLRHTEPGKHYLLKSNVITLDAGSLGVPSDNGSKLQLRFGWLKPSKIMNSFTLHVDRPNAVSYNSAPGATTGSSNSTASNNVVTVASTEGLSKGMVVTVSSGSGSFPNYTTITAVTSPTTFTISSGVALANRLQNNAVVTAGGGDKIATGANSVFTTNPTTGATTLSNLVNVDSTEGLYSGMVVTVISGGGNFRAATIISQIVSPTQIRVNQIPAGNANALSGATFVAAFSDVQYSAGEGTQAHDIATLMAGLTNNTSIQEGETVFRLIPTALLESGTNVPYRMLWKTPDGNTNFFEGIFENVTLASPSKVIMRVTKNGVGNSAQFIVTGF